MSRTKNIKVIRQYLTKRGWIVDAQGNMRKIVIEESKRVEYRCRFKQSTFLSEKREYQTHKPWQKITLEYRIEGVNKYIEHLEKVDG